MSGVHQATGRRAVCTGCGARGRAESFLTGARGPVCGACVEPGSLAVERRVPTAAGALLLGTLAAVPAYEGIVLVGAWAVVWSLLWLVAGSLAVSGLVESGLDWRQQERRWRAFAAPTALARLRHAGMVGLHTVAFGWVAWVGAWSLA